jgi:hypothetical protein
MVSTPRKFSQRDLDAWPAGLAHPVAVLGLEPAELENRYGLSFSETFDDLDRLFGVLLEIKDGHVVALVRHFGATSPGTEIWIDEQSSNPGRDLTRVLQALNLDETALTWTDPIAAHPRAGSAIS